MTRLVNFSQTSEFREAKGSEASGASCVYQEKRTNVLTRKREDLRTWRGCPFLGNGRLSRSRLVFAALHTKPLSKGRARPFERVSSCSASRYPVRSSPWNRKRGIPTRTLISVDAKRCFPIQSTTVSVYPKCTVPSFGVETQSVRSLTIHKDLPALYIVRIPL